MLSRVITFWDQIVLPKHKAKGFRSLLVVFLPQTGTIFENPSQFAVGAMICIVLKHKNVQGSFYDVQLDTWYLIKCTLNMCD